MDRYERILILHRALKSARYPIAAASLMEALQCSRATLYRDIAFLRDGLGAPIQTSETPSGFCYAPAELDHFELPGLWLSSDELYALLAAQQLLEHIGPGVLSEAIAPLRGRIDKLLSVHAGGKRWPIERIRVMSYGSRPQESLHFRSVAAAVLERRRLSFEYRARSTDTLTARCVSPQRLTHYRGHWYLDAWDHGRNAWRSFALDRIRQPSVQNEAALDSAESDLDQHFRSSYGIFSGPSKAVATIRFSAHAARWVADEHWHSKQETQWLDDGRFELRLPYSHPQELLMDVLRYGPDAEIIAPEALRQEMRILLTLALASYGA